MKEVRVKKGSGTIGFASPADIECVDLHCSDGGQIVLEGDTEVVSDGHHSFGELYQHRHMLFMTLMRSEVSWMSKLHSDGIMYPGWFIAGVALPQAREAKGRATQT